jgi:hypothetical protein
MKNKIHILITILLLIVPFSQSIPDNNFENQPLKGMNISCQTWGYEWATPEMKQ